MQRYSGSGRSRAVLAPDNMSSVEDLILSQQEIERETGISRSSVCRIAKNDIGLRVFKRKRMQVLQFTTKQKRPKYCRNCWFSEEKIILVAALLNHQNDRVY